MASVTAEDQTKRGSRSCPLCKAEIDPEALRCKYCGGDTATKKCKGCLEDIPASFAKCPKCSTTQRTYPRIPFRIAFFLFPIPLGLFAFRKHYERGFKIFAGIWLAFVLFIVFSSRDETLQQQMKSNSPESGQPNQAPSSQNATLARPEAVQEMALDISCEQFSDAFGNSSSMTQVQKKAAFSEMKGQPVLWEGEVVEVRSVFGDTIVQVKCSESTLHADLDLYLRKSEAAKANQLSLGGTVRFRGRLTDWGEITNHTVREGELLSVGSF